MYNLFTKLDTRERNKPSSYAYPQEYMHLSTEVACKYKLADHVHSRPYFKDTQTSQIVCI